MVTPAPPGGMPSMSPVLRARERESVQVGGKVNGQVVATSTSEVSADGKVMTVKTTAAGGGDALNTLVFDKK